MKMLLTTRLFLFFLIEVISGEVCINPASNCANVTCPDLLDCALPKKATDFCDPFEGCCMKRVCICTGTKSGLASTGSAQSMYTNLEKRYTNCTLVEGNVELTSLTINVTFTKHIEEVTGYVLITRVAASYIDFSSLRLIRGNVLYQDPPSACKGTAYEAYKNSTGRSHLSPINQQEYALFVFGNPWLNSRYLKELWMPNLTGILKGDVYFHLNEELCYINTVKWSDIFEDSLNQEAVIYSDSSLSCAPCSSDCYNDSGTRHCWGASPLHCQLLTKTNCSGCQVERGRCAGVSGGCCDPNCAGGCFAAANPNACYGCLTLQDDGTCVDQCPFLPTSGGHELPSLLPKKKQLYKYCVEKCPANTIQFGDICQTYCPSGFFDFDSKTCEKCKERCEHICPGLGVKGTKFENDTFINDINIKYFNKNCTIIEGSLHFKSVSFTGDFYCGVNGINLKDLERFENVREITGYLTVEQWPRSDMCIFKNLRRIRGKQTWHEKYSLSVVYHSSGFSNLRSLCLNSLKQIDRGIVLLHHTSLLCYADRIEWDDITLDKLGYQSRINSKPSNSCAPCHSECDGRFGCWGPSNTQCEQCRHYTDLTDSKGRFAPEYVIDANGLMYPGNNVTTCVSQCNALKGVYSSPDKFCLPCHDECSNKCHGPGPNNCEKCKNYENNGTCVHSCDEALHYVVNDTCLPCSLGCRDGGCAGPLNAFDEVDGCKACYYDYDIQSRSDIYQGGSCKECQRNGMNCSHGCRRTADGRRSCIDGTIQ